MLENYFKIAWRNLIKNKTFSLINISGLAIGLSCFLVIALYVIDELSYDRFHKKADRIYRVDSDIRFGGTDLKLAVCSDPMGPTLKRDYPQVEEYVRFYNSATYHIKKGNEYINESQCVHADSTFFNVFSFPVIEGDPKTALNDPNTAVISASAAKRHFGTVNAVGKILEINGSQPYKVTAVIEDMPPNSMLHKDFIFSMDNVEYEWNTWLSHNFQTFIVLKEGTDPKAFEKNFGHIIEKYVFPQAAHFMQIKSMEDFTKSGNKLKYSLMPLTRIHLHSDRTIGEFSPNGSMQYVYIFSAVALFILLIACINFMNLSTARSANRAKEVGIRKVLGTERRALISQFLFESTTMAVLSLLLAIGITYLILPLFNNIADKQLTLENLLNIRLLTLLVALPFVVGFLAGSYPALYLSAFKPIQVLKGKLNLGSKSGGIRSVLVTFQFWISIILITGTIIIYKQLNFIQNKKLGFEKEQVLVINDTWSLQQKAKVFRDQVLQLPGVVSGTLTGYLPVANAWHNDNSFFKDATMNVKDGFDMQSWRVDYDYINTLGMEIVKGRNFSRQYGTDSSAIIINETTARLLGYDDPIGKKLYSPTEINSGDTRAYTIVGVVKDFHFASLRENIGPLCFLLGFSPGAAEFKIKTTDIGPLLSKIEDIWKSTSPLPFNHSFLDESFNQMYRSEQHIGKAALVFAILAIFIACLGLFGLATFIAEQRTKEIGIRKVLGATVQTIVRLLSKDFMILVLIAFVIAVPVAWYAMNKWLQEFAYRIDISWWMFAVAGVIVLLITLLTVSFQAIKSALMNPVKSLRTE